MTSLSSSAISRRRSMTNYRIGVPAKGIYLEVFNSDDKGFGGSGVRNAGDLQTEDVPWHNRETVHQADRAAAGDHLPAAQAAGRLGRILSGADAT